MSYPPTQPSYPNPYGQQQPQPPQQQGNNLWLIGVTVIVVLAVIMAVVLLIVQRSNDSNQGGGGDPTTAPESSAEETTEGGDDPTDGGDEPVTDGEATLAESDCELYDTSGFEELIGDEVDPDESSTSASTSGDTANISCSFYTSNYDTLRLYVDVTDDSDFNIGWVEDMQDSYAEDDTYTVEDYTTYGDTGYTHESTSYDYTTIGINLAISNIEVEATTMMEESEYDRDAAIAVLDGMIAQVETYYAAHVL
ncbi:hypothetical protein [Glycomyces buryatensis]|uniref:DUF3558 domain-containing protein n=1 Tax=Glycomyces buryatensis TaxID=2570927 RepID=A0A4V4HSL6_9ACTN|nr:hypothetical protein [Glycomyces buryatensis]THV42096.1 hypothetical protein FAB82_07570 [Glycomyces buryatensis]